MPRQPLMILLIPPNRENYQIQLQRIIPNSPCSKQRSNQILHYLVLTLQQNRRMVIELQTPLKAQRVKTRDGSLYLKNGQDKYNLDWMITPPKQAIQNRCM